MVVCSEPFARQPATPQARSDLLASDSDNDEFKQPFEQLCDDEPEEEQWSDTFSEDQDEKQEASSALDDSALKPHHIEDEPDDDNLALFTDPEFGIIPGALRVYWGSSYA